jgi:hypothetical protein
VREVVERTTARVFVREWNILLRNESGMNMLIHDCG